MAQATVDIKAVVKGLRDIERLEKEMKDLQAQVKKLQGSLPKASNAIKQTGRAAATATGNIQRFGIAFRSTVAPIVAAYGALNFFNRALATTATRQADVALLTNGLQKLGGTSADLKRLRQEADAFGNLTLFNQEDYIAGAGVLTSFTDVAVKDYKRLIAISADVAATNKGPLKDSLLQVAKALNAPEVGLTALSRSGIQFSDAQKETIKALVETGNKALAQELILKELEKQYGGNAKAAAVGLAGAQDTLGESFRDFQEVVGKGVLPVVEELVVELTKVFKALSTVDPKLIENATKAAVFAAKMGLVLTAVKAVAGMKAAIVGMLAATATNATAAGNASGVAAGKVSMLAARLRALAAIGIVTVGVEFLINGAREGAKIEDLTTRLENGGSGATFDGASRETVLNAQKTARQTVAAVNKELENIKPNPWLNAIPGLGPALAGTRGSRAQQLQLRKADAQTILGLDPKNFASNAEKQAAELAALEEKIQKALNGYGDGSGTGTKTGGGTGVDKATRELERQREELERQFQVGEDIKRDQENSLALLRSTTDLDRERLQIAIDLDNQIRKIQQTAAPSQQEGLIFTATEEARLKDMIAIATSGGTGLGKSLAEGLPEVNDELTQTEQLLKNAYGIVANNLTSGIQGLIDGTKEWSDILSNVLSQLGSMFLNVGFNMLGANIGIPGFADGGRPPTNMPSIVGERGPELFVPDSAGTVLSNEDSRAVMNRWSGGNDSPIATQPIDVSYNVTEINSMRFVTEEQMLASSRAAAAQGAKRGENRAMNRLRQSRSTRSKLGM